LFNANDQTSGDDIPPECDVRDASFDVDAMFPVGTVRDLGSKRVQTLNCFEDTVLLV
jgi:hypothetical protein